MDLKEQQPPQKKKKQNKKKSKGSSSKKTLEKIYKPVLEKEPDFTEFDIELKNLTEIKSNIKEFASKIISGNYEGLTPEIEEKKDFSHMPEVTITQKKRMLTFKNNLRLLNELEGKVNTLGQSIKTADEMKADV